MKPRVESFGVEPKLGLAHATIVVPAGSYLPDAEGGFIEVFVAGYIGLNAECLNVLYDETNTPQIEMTMTDRKGKVQYYDVTFDYEAPASRALVEAIDWQEVHDES